MRGTRSLRLPRATQPRLVQPGRASRSERVAIRSSWLRKRSASAFRAWALQASRPRRGFNLGAGGRRRRSEEEEEEEQEPRRRGPLPPSLPLPQPRPGLVAAGKVCAKFVRSPPGFRFPPPESQQRTNFPPHTHTQPTPGLRRAALLAKSAAESLRGRSMERCEGEEPEPAEAPPGTRLLLAFKAFVSSRKGLLLLAQAVSAGVGVGGGGRGTALPIAKFRQGS